MLAIQLDHGNEIVLLLASFSYYANLKLDTNSLLAFVVVLKVPQILQHLVACLVKTVKIEIRSYVTYIPVAEFQEILCQMYIHS